MDPQWNDTKCSLFDLLSFQVRVTKNMITDSEWLLSVPTVNIYGRGFPSLHRSDTVRPKSSSHC